MSSQQLAWEKPGVCPACGVVTNHIWYPDTFGRTIDHASRQPVDHPLHGKQGSLRVSKCLSPDCQGLVLWMYDRQLRQIAGGRPGARATLDVVYPQSAIRHPPEEGLEPQETELYEEAAAIAPVSPRAACALVRALLEALVKRHLVAAEHPIHYESGKDKNLYDLIETAVDKLDLSSQLKRGLNAIRKRGNDAVHDPYGLTDDTRTDDLPWLFQAVDDLVDDLHTKPQRWGGMATP